MTEILALLLDHALELVAAFLLFVGRSAIARLAEWLKLRADSEVRVYFTAGLERAVDYGKAEARRRLLSRTSEVASEQLPNLTLQIARSYVQDRFPDALRRFGIDTVALDKMLSARLPAPARPFGG